MVVVPCITPCHDLLHGCLAQLHDVRILPKRRAAGHAHVIFCKLCGKLTRVLFGHSDRLIHEHGNAAAKIRLCVFIMVVAVTRGDDQAVDLPNSIRIVRHDRHVKGIVQLLRSLGIVAVHDHHLHVRVRCILMDLAQKRVGMGVFTA